MQSVLQSQKFKLMTRYYRQIVQKTESFIAHKVMLYYVWMCRIQYALPKIMECDSHKWWRWKCCCNMLNLCFSFSFLNFIYNTECETIALDSLIYPLFSPTSHFSYSLIKLLCRVKSTRKLQTFGFVINKHFTQ